MQDDEEAECRVEDLREELLLLVDDLLMVLGDVMVEELLLLVDDLMVLGDVTVGFEIPMCLLWSSLES